VFYTASTGYALAYLVCFVALYLTASSIQLCVILDTVALPAALGKTTFVTSRDCLQTLAMAGTSISASRLHATRATFRLPRALQHTSVYACPRTWLTYYE